MAERHLDPGVEYFVQEAEKHKQQKEINISTLKEGEEFTNKEITVDAVHMEHIDQPNNTENTKSIKISSNVSRKRPVRRSAEDVKIVDVDELVQKPTNKMPVKDIRSEAMDALDKAVARKQKEYRDFVENATMSDKLNRERIADGLEEAPEKEISYRIQDLPQEITKDPNPISEEEKRLEEDSMMDDVEIDLENELIGIDDQEESFHPSRVSTEDMLGDLDDDDTEDAYDHISEESREVEEDYDVDQSIEDDIMEDESEEETTIPEEEPVVEEEKKEEIVEETTVTEEATKDEDIIEERTGQVVITAINADPINIKDINNTTSDDLVLDEADFEDVDEEEEATSKDEETGLTDDQIKEIGEKSLKDIKSEILRKIVKAGKTLDTKQFAVSNRVVSIKDVLKKQKMQPVGTVAKTGTWPLMYAGRSFTASALRGAEASILDEIGPGEDPNHLGITPTQVNILYEHDMNPYKPNNAQAWAKTIPFFDIDNIFAALFLASLDGANYLPRGCDDLKCQYQFLEDKYTIDDLIKYPNDETKKRFEEVRRIKPTQEDSMSYESVINVINDDFAIGLKLPSIYSMVYEFGTLNAAFTKKYATIIGLLQYIDYIYMIDPETKSYYPITWKIYPGDAGKSYRSKISTYAKILQTFSDADFSIMIALINAFNVKNETNILNYVVPETRCPKCGATIKSYELTPRQMVFMKRQLVLLATS